MLQGIYTYTSNYQQGYNTLFPESNPDMRNNCVSLFSPTIHCITTYYNSILNSNSNSNMSLPTSTYI